MNIYNIAMDFSPVDQPPPPVDPVWSDEPSAIEHLSTETFAAFMSKSPAVLVMFYAPWCGHCKKAKPAFTAAAEAMAGAPRMALAAIDCTTNSGKSRSRKPPVSPR